jgi:uncharacterized membrane protein
MTHPEIVDTERILGRVLNVGTLVSTVTLALGLALALLRPGMTATVLLHAGIMVLLATPVMRVFVSILTFASRQEWRFVVFTTTVLLLLVIGILVAIGA